MSMASKRTYDVLITGSLVSTDLIMAEHLSRVGLKPLVLRTSMGSRGISVPEGYFQSFDLKNLIITKSPLEFLKYAHQSKLLLSITGSLLTHLSWLWPFKKLLALPPVINLTTGSDITELAVAPFRLFEFSKANYKSALYRQYLRFVDLNWCLPLPHALQNIFSLKLSNVVFMRGFPYMQPEVTQSTTALPQAQKVRFLHCSHLDWNYTNFSPSRNSTKGNDKFLRAFIRAVKAGLPIHLVILDRGADREVARKMLAAAGVESQVEWLEHLDRQELFAQIQAADIVVNMFGHGGAGSISFEALALGRPVLQYANPTFFNLMYAGNMPPFLNARTEEEIYEKISWACSTDQLTQIAEEGKEWVAKYMSPRSALQQFLFYYSLLTGEKAMDFGPFIEETEAHIQAVLSGAYDPLASLSEVS